MNSKFYFLFFVFFVATALAGFYFFDKNPHLKEAQVAVGEGFKKFVHPTIGFSLEYPENLVVNQFNEKENAKSVVFQKSTDDSSLSTEEKTGFQIYALPFDDEGKGLTLEKIKHDLPNVAIEEPVEAFIGEKAGEPKKAWIFWIQNPKIGRTREVWFVDKGYLFEVTTYAHLDLWLAQIMSTWSCCG